MKREGESESPREVPFISKNWTSNDCTLVTWYCYTTKSTNQMNFFILSLNKASRNLPWSSLYTLEVMMWSIALLNKLVLPKFGLGVCVQLYLYPSSKIHGLKGSFNVKDDIKGQQISCNVQNGQMNYLW